VFRRIRRFVGESYSELKKVTWPTREHTRNLTVLVFVISAIVGAYIGFFDLLFGEVLEFVAEAT
jgi:preprotein translocase SecE subunit